MKRTLDKWEIVEALRADDYADWSLEGATALAEWLEEYEESTGVELELDVVALRCEFDEYESALDWCGCYFGTCNGKDNALCDVYDEDDDEDEREEKALEHLRDNTMLIEFDRGIIVQAF